MLERDVHTQDSVDVLILGAGICGLTIAQDLEIDGKLSWLMLDKGRSVGGRMATRRIGGHRFDHGAQFFTARSDVFKRYVETWVKDGAVKEWTKGFNHHFHVHDLSNDDGHSRYAGVGGMNQIAKYLAAKLPEDRILLQEKIIELGLTEKFFLPRSEAGHEFMARSVVCTTPAPQALQLLSSSQPVSGIESIAAELSRIVYDSCVALMGFFDPDDLPLNALPIQSKDAVISFMADNCSKGLSTEKGALTIHLAPEASRGMFSAQDQVIAEFVCHQLKQLFGVKKISLPSSYEIQRWRYASPQNTLERPFLEWSGAGLSSPRLFFAGEAFGGPKIEGAFTSAKSVAQRLINLS